eukprot:TRINITY_DN31924_c0_g1_i1.p1 TRINITY_DN31924_c0_g1~~TRINITY_DN31924_c0_g1_i1.p1  ORF type:complete len:352 (+),score=113.53 TRINITY_DN31924_c0_g1_i1:31-1056(+)
MGASCCRRRTLAEETKAESEDESRPLKEESEDAERVSETGRTAAERRILELQQQVLTGGSAAERRLKQLQRRKVQDAEAVVSGGAPPEKPAAAAKAKVEEEVITEIDGCTFGKPRGPPKKEQQQTLREILKRADMLLQEGVWEAALNEYDAAVQLAPKDWRGHRGKAMAWQGIGNFLRAYSACKRGIEQLPSNKGLAELAERCRVKYKERQKADQEARQEEVVPEGRKTLSQEEAKEFLDTAIAEFDNPQNAEKLKALAAEVQSAGDDMIARQDVIQKKLLPQVVETLGPHLQKYDLGTDDSMNALMEAVMQIQFYATSDTEMQPKVQRMIDFVMTGKLHS